MNTNAVVYLIIICFFLYVLQILISDNLLLLSDNRNVVVKKKPQLPLKFNSDGRFKILQVADMHYGNGVVTRCRDVLPSQFKYCSDLNTTSFLERIIHLEKPDFVAFTGDNIHGKSAADAAESLYEVLGPVRKSGIPWAAVLGNHDQESTMTREELMTYISLMDYSVSQTYPSIETSDSLDERHYLEDIDGYGNYNLQVYGAPGSQLANSSIFNLFFLDSGDRETVDGIRTYGWIKESQLHWLQEISQGLKEAVASSIMSSGVLETFVSMGDVKAVFIGHDHTNDFCGELDGIWFCYGGGFGYHGYGKAGWPRRARVIMAELGKGEKGWMGVERIKTWKRLDDESMSKIDEQVLWEQR